MNITKRSLLFLLTFLTKSWFNRWRCVWFTWLRVLLETLWVYVLSAQYECMSAGNFPCSRWTEFLHTALLVICLCLQRWFYVWCSFYVCGGNVGCTNTQQDYKETPYNYCISATVWQHCYVSVISVYRLVKN